MLLKYYVEPLINIGIPKNNILAANLEYTDTNTAPMKLINTYLPTLLKALNRLKINLILCNDSAYFKALTKLRKVDMAYGAIYPCAIKDYEHLNITLGVNYSALFYNPLLQSKIDLSIQALEGTYTKNPVIIGADIIHGASYPNTDTTVEKALSDLLKYEALTCDIETFGLPFDSGLASISFAWDRHNGVAFELNDFRNISLRKFFNTYTGKLIFHNCTFDTKHLIHQLYMNDYSDTAGMLQGLHALYRDIEDTKIIAYLATNTTAGNKLSLKEVAFEFAGNYAIEEIGDVRLLPVDRLLEYNLTDCLATWYVYEEYGKRMRMDSQEKIYRTIMMPSQKVICQMELTGMCLDMDAVLAAKETLKTAVLKHETFLVGLPTIEATSVLLTASVFDTHQAKLKTKILDRNAYPVTEFSPASPTHLRVLLHDVFGLPVLDTTDTGLAATGAKTLKKYMNSLISKHRIKPEELL